ncbi:chromosomal replication initiator protein DnaA [Thioflexithrix psekupsensis]|uniref:Chromosomal replication initiator protein DnaA n=1 Tax=Thioflexithrix psekupsensis TaxID=1570016 RepID=A0A251X6I9_9GAMM|nr:chromosomal replication initiator protein DnaA [Thioflexithrix psekupsensis]OUD13273.1 hypothetical protein TPSD3_11625 [Thioflexithrix psekupsensis]
MTTHLWNQCLRTLEHELAGVDFNTWIRPLQAVEANDSLCLLAPNQFVLNWVRDHYYQKINGMLQHLRPEQAPSLILQIGSRRSPTAASRPNTPRSSLGQAAERLMQSVKPSVTAEIPASAPLAAGLNPQLTFAHFIAGESNQLARSAAYQLADSHPPAYRLLYIYGGVGLGKTHLLHAIGNHLAQKEPNSRISYVHAERFVGELIKALREKNVAAFKQHYRSLDTLLIDDIQFFAHKQQSQEELLHTFNHLFEMGKRIVLVGDRPPQQLEGIEARLTSRFGCGLAVGIDAPDYATRVAILKTKAQAQGMTFNEEVCHFIAHHIPNSVRELEGALHRVIAIARFTAQPITLANTQQALQDMLGLEKPALTLEFIQHRVADYFKISVADLCSRRRHRHLTRPRQLAMMLIKELTRCSYPEIGVAFSGRDHSTVIHNCKTFKKLQSEDVALRRAYEELRQLLLE